MPVWHRNWCLHGDCGPAPAGSESGRIKTQSRKLMPRKLLINKEYYPHTGRKSAQMVQMHQEIPAVRPTREYSPPLGYSGSAVSVETSWRRTNTQDSRQTIGGGRIKTQSRKLMSPKLLINKEYYPRPGRKSAQMVQMHQEIPAVRPTREYSPPLGARGPPP